VAAGLILGLGCASQRPVLYPNPALRERGREQADHDIETCMRYAEESGAENERAERVARGTAERGAAGGAAGAVGGAIAGSAGRGAAIGAASAATWGFVRGLFESDAPDPVFRGFVDKCLRDLGYEPIGWK
jgi:hypothetical protein